MGDRSSQMSRFVFGTFWRFCKRVCSIRSGPCTSTTSACRHCCALISLRWGIPGATIKYPSKICHRGCCNKTRPLESLESWRASCRAQVVEACKPCKPLEGTSSARFCRLVVVEINFLSSLASAGNSYKEAY